MDQMLPSPGYSIPSLGTPLHQQEEDQVIMSNVYPHPSQAMHPSLGGAGPSVPNASSAQSSSSAINPYASSLSGSGPPGLSSPMMVTPQKSIQPYGLPQSTSHYGLMQPQTPVSPKLSHFIHSLTYLLPFSKV